MYCPAVIMSPFLSLDMNRKQRCKGAFVSPKIFYSTRSVEIMSEWMRTISQANFVSCGPSPLMSIPKSFLTSPSNIYPKSVLKIARLGSSFARYTFTLITVTLLTLIVMQLSLWLFLSFMRIFIASTMSVTEKYSAGSI